MLSYVRLKSGLTNPVCILLFLTKYETETCIHSSTVYCIVLCPEITALQRRIRLRRSLFVMSLMLDAISPTLFDELSVSSMKNWGN